MARDYADYANMFKFATAGTGTSTGWPNAGGRTLLLRRLLANPGFRDHFIRRCTDLLNTAFHEERVLSFIDSMAAVLRPEIPAHLQRWSWDELTGQGYGAPYQREYQPFTQATWETNLTVLREFAKNRPALVRSQCATHFGLGDGNGTLRVRVNPPNAGAVQLNSLFLTNSVWEGIYFTGLTNDLQAIARPGFRVRGWTTDTGLTASPFLRAIVSADHTNTMVAEFEPLATPPAPPRRQSGSPKSTTTHPTTSTPTTGSNCTTRAGPPSTSMAGCCGINRTIPPACCPGSNSHPAPPA